MENTKRTNIQNKHYNEWLDNLDYILATRNGFRFAEEATALRRRIAVTFYNGITTMEFNKTEMALLNNGRGLKKSDERCYQSIAEAMAGGF